LFGPTFHVGGARNLGELLLEFVAAFLQSRFGRCSSFQATSGGSFRQFIRNRCSEPWVDTPVVTSPFPALDEIDQLILVQRRQIDEPQPRFPGKERLSASLLPSEIVRPKSVQVVKLDRVVVARRMQDHAVRPRACLFVADIGIGRETFMMIDGSPPVRAVPNEFAAGFAASLDVLEALLFRGQ
jgi:hypothetical protein